MGALVLSVLVASCESPTARAPVNKIEFVSSIPAPGGMIHTGVPDPRNLSVTTGLTMTFLVTSDTDRVARLVVFLEGSQNGVCLTNGAPIGIPPGPVTEYRAGTTVEVTIAELLLTSVCRYPNRVDLATARLMPASRSAPDQTPYYQERFALTYTITEQQASARLMAGPARRRSCRPASRAGHGALRPESPGSARSRPVKRLRRGRSAAALLPSHPA